MDAGGECLWLWQGWWPEIGHETGDTNLSTGSGLIRWHAGNFFQCGRKPPCLPLSHEDLIAGDKKSPLACSGFLLCPFCTVEYVSSNKHFQCA